MLAAAATDEGYLAGLVLGVVAVIVVVSAVWYLFSRRR
jgi:hypothetical protein